MLNAVKTDREENRYNRVSSDRNHEQWLTVRQFCEAFPWPSESAMRAYVYRAEEIGISDAFVRVGRRVLVSPSKFFTKIEQKES